MVHLLGISLVCGLRCLLVSLHVSSYRQGENKGTYLSNQNIINLTPEQTSIQKIPLKIQNQINKKKRGKEKRKTKYGYSQD